MAFLSKKYGVKIDDLLKDAEEFVTGLASSGGTVLMPICALLSTWPFSPIKLPGVTVSVNAPRSASVKAGAAAASGTVITVD